MPDKKNLTAAIGRDTLIESVLLQIQADAHHSYDNERVHL